MNAGDTVRLRKIPDSVLENGERFPESFRLFEQALGRCFTIRRKHPHGLVEFWVDPAGRNSENPCADSLYIEKECLEVEAVKETREQ